MGNLYSHTSRTPRNLPPLSHALHLPPPVRLRLAHHVIVVERLASRADEEGGTEQGRGTGTDFGDFGNGVWQGGRVEEDFLVESGGQVSREFRMVLKRGEGGSPWLTGCHCWCCDGVVGLSGSGGSVVVTLVRELGRL